MNRINRESTKRVLDLHFQGLSNVEIAVKLGMPESTVGDAISLLPDNLAPLADFSKDLEKHNMNVFESKKGAQFKARLANLGVPDDKLESYIESSEKRLTNPDYTPEKIVRAQMKLNDLEQEAGKPYSEVLRDFEEKNQGNETLKREERQTLERLGGLKNEVESQLRENAVTRKEITYSVNLRETFREHDIRLDDAENLAKYIKNMKETGGDPGEFVRFTLEHGSVIERTNSLRSEETSHSANLQKVKEQENNVEAKIVDLGSLADKEEAKFAEVRRRTRKAEKKEAAALERAARALGWRPK